MSWLLKSLLFLLSTIVLGVLCLVVSSTSDSVSELAGNNLADSTRLARWGVLGAGIIFWDNIVDLIAKQKRLTDEQAAIGKRMRWRLTLGLLGFELFVVESLPVKIVQLFQ